MSLSVSFSASRFRMRWQHGRRWGTRALFAVIDQGLISGSNFLLGIQLARSLHPARYGAYALAFSMFSLLSMVHQAIVLEPMSVFGGSKYRGARRHYVGRLLVFQTAIGAACLAVLLTAAAWVYTHGSRELALALLGVAFATPCVLLLAFARRALYLEYRSNAAAGGAVLYSGLLFLAFWLLERAGFLSPFAVFLEIGAAALAASAILMIAIHPSVTRGQNIPRHAIVSEHWCYGRWALGSCIFMWISWNLWYTIVGSIAGLAATGTLKALINFAMPVIQSCAAISLLVLPYTAQVTSVEGRKGANRQAALVGLLFTAGAAVYWIAILIWQRPLIAFLYAGQYDNASTYLPWLALASLASAAIVGPVSALRALESPFTVCLAFFIASFVGVSLGIPATRAYGVAGAVGGMLISSALALGIVVVALARHGKPPARSAAVEMESTVWQ